MMDGRFMGGLGSDRETRRVVLGDVDSLMVAVLGNGGGMVWNNGDLMVDGVIMK